MEAGYTVEHFFHDECLGFVVDDEWLEHRYATVSNYENRNHVIIQYLDKPSVVYRIYEEVEPIAVFHIRPKTEIVQQHSN